MLHQLPGADLGVIQQMYAGVGDLAQVVRRHIGGHTHGDARRAVEQQVGQARRQNQRLLQRAVKVRPEVDCAIAQFTQQQLGIAR